MEDGGIGRTPRPVRFTREPVGAVRQAGSDEAVAPPPAAVPTAPGGSPVPTLTVPTEEDERATPSGARLWRAAGVAGVLVVALVAAGLFARLTTSDRGQAGPNPTPPVVAFPTPTPTPTPTPPVDPAGFVAAYAGYVPDDGSFLSPALTLLVALDEGTFSIDTARCLIPGTGRYTMSLRGDWSFDAGGLAEARCPNGLVAKDYRVLIDTLSHGTSWHTAEYDWSYSTSVQGLPTGRFITVSGGGNTVYLRVPDTYRPEPLPAFGSLAPDVRSPGSGDLSSLVGTWDITTFWPDAASPRVPNPAVSLVVSGAEAILPRGCTFGTEDYVATADGHWYFGSDLIATDAMGCDPDQMQVDEIYAALARTTAWGLVGLAISSTTGDFVNCGQLLTLQDAAGMTTLNAVQASADPACLSYLGGSQATITYHFESANSGVSVAWPTPTP